MFQSYYNSFQSLSLFSVHFPWPLNQTASDISSYAYICIFIDSLYSPSFSSPGWLLSTHSAQPHVTSAPRTLPQHMLVSFQRHRTNSSFGYRQLIKLHRGYSGSEIWEQMLWKWFLFMFLFSSVSWLLLHLFESDTCHKVISTSHNKSHKNTVEDQK